MVRAKQTVTLQTNLMRRSFAAAMALLEQSNSEWMVAIKASFRCQVPSIADLYSPRHAARLQRAR